MSDTKIRAVRYHEHGDESVLRLDDISRPTPSADEVLLDVHAASINPIDTYVREGTAGTGNLPRIIGSDVAGVVSEIGADVKEFEPGDRVYATCRGISDNGTLAEACTVPTSVLAHLPDSIAFADGAAAAMTFVTAWRALVVRADMSIGDRCLISGAAGGVGHAGVQIANAAGGTVIGLARPELSSFVADIGADSVVDYRKEDLADEIMTAAGGPISVVLESHAGTNLDADIGALDRGGRIVIIGEEDPIIIESSLSMQAKQADGSLQFMSIASSVNDQKPILETIAQYLANGYFEPHIDSQYRIGEAASAYQRLEENGVKGSIVIEVRDSN